MDTEKELANSGKSRSQAMQSNRVQSLLNANNSSDLDIIIVSFNSAEHLRCCLRSIYDNKTRRTFDIHVVDNGSTDSTLAFLRANYPRVALIHNGSNMGYSYANNQALALSDSQYMLLLNPDTELPSNAFETLLDVMDAHPQIGMIGPKLVRPNGQLDFACKRSFPVYPDYVIWLLGLSRRFPSSRIIGRYNLTYLSPDTPAYVESIAGAFMLARREAARQVGKLDESFFLYAEDLDWCYKFARAGWPILYYPAISVLHHKGGASRRFSERSIYHFYRSNSLLYRKYVAPHTPFILNWILYVAMSVRFLMSICYNFLLPADRKRVA